jgi:hypothetical protein
MKLETKMCASQLPKSSSDQGSSVFTKGTHSCFYNSHHNPAAKEPLEYSTTLQQTAFSQRISIAAWDQVMPTSDLNLHP